MNYANPVGSAVRTGTVSGNEACLLAERFSRSAQRTLRAATGFTLLELLLALSMVTLLTVSLYASLRLGFKARDSAQQALTPVRAAHLAMDLVRRDLDGAMPPKGLLAGPMISYSEGAGAYEIESLEFYSNAPDPGRLSGEIDAVPLEGIRRIQLSVEMVPGDDRLCLVRRVTPMHQLAYVSQQELVPDPEVLCRGVRGFGIRYFDGSIWQEEWDSTLYGDVLPLAIEVSLDIDRSNTELDRNPNTPAYRVVRVFAIPCGEYPVDTSAEETGGTQS